MTGLRKDTSITRRRALAVTGGTVAAGGLAAAGYQAAFADTGTTAGATAGTTAGATAGTTSGATVSASVGSTGTTCMTLMTSVTKGPYCLDGALVRKDITCGRHAPERRPHESSAERRPDGVRVLLRAGHAQP
ncbi:hypothetical protein [Streptomyces sp. NBC_00425]|uniref:hypothetical protein n=1 Tax=Streptomyces sp. NBC_00425 TaxID=2975740 RepID=UPI003FCCA2AA